MKVTQVVSLASLAVCVAGGGVFVSGCSSVPLPAQPDGSTRVAANEPGRVEAVHQRAVADAKVQAENSVLRAQVDALQAKVNDLAAIMRESLTLPPGQRSQAVPLPPAAASAPRVSLQPSALPGDAFTANSAGVVIRVFHPFAKTDFRPTDSVAQALQTNAAGAQRIEVRGYTDSNVVDPIDKLIAIERAEKARAWLITNGVDPGRIRTKYFAAGRFYADNHTEEGRSLNRRVEIDIRNKKPSDRSVASST